MEWAGPPRGPPMSYAEPLRWHSASSHSHPARRMSLSPEQHSRIAATYHTAAFDMSLPAHTRAAFAKKENWFRLRARAGEMRERAALTKQTNPFWFIVARHQPRLPA